MSAFSQDFLIDLATSLPDIRESEMEPPTMSWGLNLDFLDEEPQDISISRDLNSDNVSPSPPAACHNVVVLPRNSQVAVLCGCRGKFLWELIPKDYCNFYLLPHLVNTVHCSGADFWQNRGFNDKSVKTSKIVALDLLIKIGYGPIA